MPTAHTPGPWVVEVTSDGWDGTTTWIRGAGGESVVCGWGYDAWGLAWGQQDEPCRTEDVPQLPDARLIAAAPELLAALRSLLDEYVRLANTGDCGFWNPEKERQVVEARAAIAKAEGRTIIEKAS